MTTDEEQFDISSIPLDKPTSARAYGWMLGGRDNFEIDRDFILATLEGFPECVDIARQNRQFRYRVVRYLVQAAGIDQFIGLGCSLPTGNKRPPGRPIVRPGRSRGLRRQRLAAGLQTPRPGILRLAGAATPTAAVPTTWASGPVAACGRCVGVDVAGGNESVNGSVNADRKGHVPAGEARLRSTGRSVAARHDGAPEEGLGLLAGQLPRS
jgi:hypothetical protein